MISTSKSPYSPIQNPASERSERAINMLKTVIAIILSYFLISNSNRQKMTEHSKNFSNFFGITEIDGSLVLKSMHVIFPNVSVLKIVT